MPRTLPALDALEGVHELIFVDGGSTDGTAEWLRSRGRRVLSQKPCRGAQLAAGAAESTGEILWFLHADCVPCAEAPLRIQAALANGCRSGVCQVRFSGSGIAARFMTWLYPRLAVAGLYYGDAGLFVRRDAYDATGGFRPLPVFEDLDLVTRLRRQEGASFQRLAIPLEVSSRRFAHGRFPFVFARWILLQSLYWIGVPPARIARFYGPVR